MSTDTKWIIGTVIVLAGLLSAQIAAVNSSLNARIDGLRADLNARMDDFEARAWIASRRASTDSTSACATSRSPSASSISGC